MPFKSPTTNRTKDGPSDPSTPSPTPSRKPLGRGFHRSRACSLSPRKRQAKQPLHIRMNLTETQMDRITDAFTSKVNNSPVRTRRRVEATPTKSTPQAHQGQDASSPRHRTTYSPSSGEGSRVASTTFSDLMPGHHGHLFPASLAERRQQHPPPPIRVGDGDGDVRAPGSTPRRPQMESVSHAVSPLSPTRGGRHARAGSQDVSPYYQSGQAEWPCYPNTQSGYSSDANGPVVDMYRAWAQMRSPADDVDGPPQSLAQRPRRSKSTSDGFSFCPGGLRRLEGLESGSTSPPPPLPAPAPAQAQAQASAAVTRGPVEPDESALFSPLALYFRGHDFPSTKKGEKTMIGHNGWLERTERAASERDKKTPQRRTGILQSIKKIAKDMTADFHYGNRRSQPSAKEGEAGAARVRISLDAREQSLLYCELEFHLTTALNDYATAELDKGHLVPDNLKKISDWWMSQGRPKVVGFRYDLETQLELVSLHVDDFNFYGRRQSNPVEIAGLLDTMKTNARQMRVRTFCQPDSVVAKQLVDAQSLFNMISVSNAQQVALAEIAHFFNVIVERERDCRERRVRDVRKTRTVPQPRPILGSAESERQRQGFESGALAYEGRARAYEVDRDPLPYAR